MTRQGEYHLGLALKLRTRHGCLCAQCRAERAERRDMEELVVLAQQAMEREMTE